MGSKIDDDAIKNERAVSTVLETNRLAITEPGLKEFFQESCGAVKKVIHYNRMGLSLYAPEHKALKLIAAGGQGADSFYRSNKGPETDRAAGPATRD